ncbi:MAG: hypothetical protein CFE26_23165, partial [Verrucomicrobiales bacterium VVV1]
NVPADGDYFVRVTDHLERGGPNFVYRIEMVASQPDLTFASPNYSVNDSHYRQFMAVPRGGRMALLENFSRSNVSGDFKFDAAGLPPGVKMLSEIVPKDQPSNVIYYTEIEDKLPVAVVEEVPYSLEIVKPTVPLVNNGVMNLKVVAKRKEGFKTAIRVLMVWKPIGVSVLGEQTIPEGQNECTFVLDANA